MAVLELVEREAAAAPVETPKETKAKKEPKAAKEKKPAKEKAAKEKPASQGAGLFACLACLPGLAWPGLAWLGLACLSLFSLFKPGFKCLPSVEGNARKLTLASLWSRLQGAFPLSSAIYLYGNRPQ